MAKALLQIQELSKYYGKECIFSEVNFDLYEGEILGLAGRSGSGKTTLLQTIAGLEVISSGEILLRISEHEYTSLQGKYFSKTNLFGYSFQQASFYPELTVMENIFYFARMHGLDRDEIIAKAGEVLKTLELEHHIKAYAKNLSEGMKRRLDFACALMHEPKVLFLDEPTAELDIFLREELLKIIKKLSAKNIAIIFISHSLEEIKNICTRSLILHNTKVSIVKGTQVEEALRQTIKNGKSN
ncbi:ABC transporter ATP-binding protein [Candidatus Woesearchaeota archaeon]|nr:ABC transporter ATP-binding protein [Nanoarchaeota archaeon]MCB9370173.1 ABC transporter ATP-binding protein [Candidatus Woesearchaeota archaeon]USN44703.1 MAG: ABC transporter ATP-binding protein [Candidatus Woesearchaeota archaeon]